MTRRIEALAKASGDVVWGVTRMPGDRIYYLRRKVGESQLKLVMRVGLTGPERVLVDPERLAKATGVPYAINYFVPSWDGRTLAYGISAGGSEDSSLNVMDVASGMAVGVPIPRVREDLVHWTPDSRSLTFNQVRALAPGTAATETYLDTTVFVIAPRRPGAIPRALFGPLVNTALKLDRLDVAEVMFAPNSHYMVARTTDTTLPEGRLYVAALAQLGRKRIDWRQISGFADKITQVALRGDTLYLRTYAGAPRGRVLALALADPVLGNATLVVPEPAAGALQRFALGRDAVYAEVHRGFNVRVRRYAGDQPGQGEDAAPGLSGTTRMSADPASAYTDAWVYNNTWTEPDRVQAIGADGSTWDTRLLTSVRPDGAPELEVSEVLVPSHDGAMVPLAIVRRKALALDGTHPTLLVGYGAYGHSIDAYFDPRSIAWLERGGVLAYANVRGSGAFGDAWYRAGFKATKPNTWKDGIACARYLIEQRYTSPATLGIWGTSAGGIFVGRAVTTAPELFAAAIFDVGLMDTVRAEESANGITNVSEFGSVKDPAEFAALREMSTYSHITDGTAYAAVMFIHGLNDPRVDVWHSAKAAARLQAATSSGRPILMRLDGHAGHGVGSTAEQRAAKQADIYSFLLWQFGKMTLKD
jgi:prolyl oligopeptidase